MIRSKAKTIYLISIIGIGVCCLVFALIVNENIPPIFPKGSSRSVLFSWIGLMVIGLITLLGAGYLAIGLLASGRSMRLPVIDKIDCMLKKRIIKLLINAVLILTGFGAGQLLLQISASQNNMVVSFLRYNQPFLFWLLFSSTVSLVYYNGVWQVENNLEFSRIIIPGLIFLVIFIALLVVNFSPWGFQKDLPDAGSFRLTGFPILDYQVLLAGLLAIGGSILLGRLNLRFKFLRKVSAEWVDLILIAVLFLGASIIWIKAPVIPNAFIDKPRPPNHQFYPNLDPVVYDRTALNLLTSGEMQTYIGDPDLTGVARRPLFTFYLTVLHWINGNNYLGLIRTQVVFFALFPVLIYIFTKKVHNRISAFFAALLIIIRQLNGVWLEEDVWGGTTLHMLMSDILAAMIMVLLMSLILDWLDSQEKSGSTHLVIGGVIGLGMLIRQEMLVMLPVAILLVLLDCRIQWKKVTGKLILLTSGMLIVIFPWMMRNYLKTGLIYLDKPGKVTTLLFNTFDLQLNPNLDELSLEGDSVPTETQSPDQIGSLINELGHTIALIGNHGVNAYEQLFLYLPSNPVWFEIDFIYRLFKGEVDRVYGGIFYSPYAYSKSLPYWWWDKWNGRVDNLSWLYLGINILLISVGIDQIRKKKPGALLLMGLSLMAMIGVYALIRRSGGRFLQTVDWIPAVLYSIGIVEIVKSLIKNFRISEVITTEPDRSPLDNTLRTKQWGWLVYGVIFILAVLPVATEYFLPNHFPETNKENRLTQLLAEDQEGLSEGERKYLADFLEGEGDVLYGAALYPRYFPPDAALMTLNETLFPASTTFTIAGSELNFVVLPRLDSPEWFPQGAETLVFGCRQSSLPEDSGFPCLGCNTGEFEALVVVLYNPDSKNPVVLWRDGNSSSVPGCPFN